MSFCYEGCSGVHHMSKAVLETKTIQYVFFKNNMQVIWFMRMNVNFLALIFWNKQYVEERQIVSLLGPSTLGTSLGIPYMYVR